MPCDLFMMRRQFRNLKRPAEETVPSGSLTHGGFGYRDERVDRGT